MLIVADSFRKLSFGKLMEVYAQTNAETGRRKRPEEPEARQIAMAEDAFFAFLTDVFFRTPGAVYLIWEESGKYCSALRLEPYRDSWLLNGLETAPDCRNQGFGSLLISAALDWLKSKGADRVISHVNKKNTVSLTVHQHLGFRIISDYSVYLDGSADSKSYTLEFLFPKAEKMC